MLLPVQYYFDKATNGGYCGTFWRSIPRYFASMHPPLVTAWPETLLAIPFPGHLWFLQYLLLISLTTLPLPLCLRSARGQRLIAKFAEICGRRGGILLFLIPLALALVRLRGLFEAQRSWADLVWSGIHFATGYVLAAGGRFSASIVKHGWVCLGLWVLGFFGGIGFLDRVVGYDPLPGRESFSFVYVLYQVAWSITSWSAVVFVLNLGAKLPNRYHDALAWASEGVLPFYLLHQTVILVVGIFVVRWNPRIMPKLVLVIAISFPVVVILRELLVRPFTAVRWLFGVKQQVRPSAGARSIVGQGWGSSARRRSDSAVLDEAIRL